MPRVFLKDLQGDLPFKTAQGVANALDWSKAEPIRQNVTYREFDGLSVDTEYYVPVREAIPMTELLCGNHHVKISQEVLGGTK